MPPPDEWIGVAEVADEMNYTPRQAWEFLRKIEVPVTNSRSMKLARFTRREYEEFRDRSRELLTPRVETGALAKYQAPEVLRKAGDNGGAASIRDRLKRL